MSSDNIDSRREARRRKILENSEKRLKLITGKSCFENNSEIRTGFEENVIVNKLDVPIYEVNNGSLLRNISDDIPHVVKNDLLTPINISATCGPSIGIFIYLAIIFRFALEMDVQCIFTNSMVIAFMLAKCGTLSLYGLPISESSRFFGNLLLLSGINSSGSTLMTVGVSALFSVLRDFALYTFIFIFVDMCIHIVKILI